jgi:hypothetical protein
MGSENFPSPELYESCEKNYAQHWRQCCLTATVAEPEETSLKKRQVFSTAFQPVISVPLGDQWHLVNRPMFRFIDAELPKLSLAEGGLGTFPGRPGVGPPTSGPPTFQDWDIRVTITPVILNLIKTKQGTWKAPRP